MSYQAALKCLYRFLVWSSNVGHRIERVELVVIDEGVYDLEVQYFNCEDIRMKYRYQSENVVRPGSMYIQELQHEHWIAVAVELR